MKRFTVVLVLVLTGCALSAPDGGEDQRAAPSHISVSGLSSGGYMAGQFHLAFADEVNGAAIVAAGPYRCAEGNLMRAIGDCIKGGAVDASRAVALATAASTGGDIATLNHLAGDRVWILHGTNDTVVARQVVDVLAESYRTLGDGQVNVKTVFDLPAGHGLPALESSIPCDQMAAPFVNDCDFDAAGDLLKFLTDRDDATPSPQGSGTLAEQQYAFSDKASLSSTVLVYTPDRCSTEQCGIHLALHGCGQSASALAEYGGYQRWADSLGLVVAFPQVQPLPGRNPFACWDWWGYTGRDYASRQAPQIRALHRIIQTQRQRLK